MKSNKRLVTNPMRGALVAGLLAIGYVGSVSAVDLPLVLQFSQTAGFYAGDDAGLKKKATLSRVGAAVVDPSPGFGGLEFSTLVTGPPGPPLGFPPPLMRRLMSGKVSRGVAFRGRPSPPIVLMAASSGTDSIFPMHSPAPRVAHSKSRASSGT